MQPICQRLDINKLRPFAVERVSLSFVLAAHHHPHHSSHSC